jgi:ketosteroid isomerase-like protein
MSEIDTLDAQPRHAAEASGAAPVVTPGIRSPLHHAQAIFSALDAQDIDALAALMTEDVRLQIGNAEALHGKAEFVRGLQAFFGSVTSFGHTVTNVWSDLDAVIAELKVHYTRLDGRELTLPCCNVFRVRDGAVSDYRVYMDMTPVYVQG